MYEYYCTDVFFEGAIFHKKKLVQSWGIGRWGESIGRVRVGVGGDKEIWTQLICVGADYFL